MRNPFARLLIASLLLLLLPAILGPAARAQDPVVRFLFFYNESCPVCRQIKNEYIPTLFAKYGDQVACRYIEIWDDPESHRAMRGLMLKLEVPQNRQDYVPVVVIGDDVLAGEEIPDRLEERIDHYLAEGGVDYASLENLPQPVQVALFYDPADDSFATLDRLTGLLANEHGAWLQLHALDLSDPGSADLLAQYASALGLSPPAPGVPHALIGREMLVGLDEIESRLPDLVAEHRARGGVELATVEALSADPSGGERPPIYVAYFEKAGCQTCARAAYDLRLVQEDYPQMVIDSFPIDEYGALNEWLCEQYGVPEAKRLTTPMVFVGDDVLVDHQVNAGNLTFAVARYAATGSERTWEDYDEAQGEQQLIERFRSFGLLTVLGAGLIDGLNPCAFATLVFFISYMTFTGRKGREVLLVGSAFALGVFFTYLLVGVGLLRAVQSLGFFTSLGRWVYAATALMCVVLAVLTFRDVLRARSGQAGDMALRLPRRLQMAIHRVIRQNARVRAFAAVALVTGFVVSLIELACTGQVYLPTLMFVLSVPEMAAQAFLYLTLYCLAFVLPLVVVFLFSYLGTTSQQLGLFVHRHTAAIKGLTGLVFVGLALWMTWTLAPLFGATTTASAALLGGVLAAIVLSVFGSHRLERRPAS